MIEPRWVDEYDALVLHDRLLALHGGAPGVSDAGLLSSAIARPRQHFAHNPKVDVIDLAAIYTAGIVRNHAFVDGNKRTGFVIGILFLEMNGYRFIADEAQAASAVWALAGRELDETGYAAFLRANAIAQAD